MVCACSENGRFRLRAVVSREVSIVRTEEVIVWDGEKNMKEEKVMSAKRRKEWTDIVFESARQ